MRKFIVLLMLVPCLAWAQKTTAPQQPKKQKWEYFIYKLNPTPRDYEKEYTIGDYEDKEANFFNPNIEVLDSLGVFTVLIAFMFFCLIIGLSQLLCKCLIIHRQL